MPNWEVPDFDNWIILTAGQVNQNNTDLGYKHELYWKLRIGPIKNSLWSGLLPSRLILKDMFAHQTKIILWLAI